MGVNDLKRFFSHGEEVDEIIFTFSAQNFWVIVWWTHLSPQQQHIDCKNVWDTFVLFEEHTRESKYCW